MKKLFVFVSAIVLVLSLSACKPKEIECDPGYVLNEAGDACVEEANDAPVITGETSVSISQFAEFDASGLVSATDTEDGSLDVVVESNDVNVEVPGDYTVVFSAEDSKGKSVEFTVTVTVEALPQVLANYLSGVDLSKLDAEQKGILFAAAERFLLENAFGGIPLYRGASRVMYSSRLQLFSPTYNSVLGFGTKFSQFSEDDSTVLMYDDVYGQAGEYTYRSSFNTDPTSLNPWIADDSASSDFIDLFTGALYSFYFDASKEGFELNGELAAGEPIPVDGEELYGKVYATTWQIEIKDGLTWTFHPDTDTSALAAGYEDLDANDYMWTWKTAFDLGWFRATAGGGDFISQGVKNAAEYAAGTASWEDVGLKAIDDNTLQITFSSSKRAFDVKYMFGGGSLTPINQQLYEYVNADAAEGEDNYGLDPQSVASSGIYYFDTWTTGQLLLFKKNVDFVDADMYHYTAQQYRFIDGSDNIFEEFLAGRLEGASVPSSRVSEFLNDPRVKTSPDATTWRLQINGFGSTEARDAYIEQYDAALSNEFVPEPLLGYTEARLALQYGFDRYHAAVEVVGTYLPAFDLFAETYFLDGESGIGVRGTEAGAAILEEFGGDSYGYYPDAAVDLFKQAVAQAIEDGHYTAGTASEYTVIELSLTYASSGNTGAQAMVAELESQYEALLVDDENFVRIDIVVADVAFPNNYYDYMMKANTDLGIGGISGSLLDAPSFLDVFNDNNVSGFTLNWGIDTTTPGVEVVYENLEGEMVSEIWGYNALVDALNGKEYIKDGQVQTAWDDADDLIAAYVDMTGEEVGSTADGNDIAFYILGDELDAIAEDEGFDSLVAYTVTTVSGLNQLYVLSELDGDFELYTQAALMSTPEEAIINHSGYGYDSYFVGINGLLEDDAAVAANPYAIDMGWATIADLVAASAAPAEFAEFYDTAWDGWDDIYVVLHIGDFYIGWAWL